MIPTYEIMVSEADIDPSTVHSSNIKFTVNHVEVPTTPDFEYPVTESYEETLESKDFEETTDVESFNETTERKNFEGTSSVKSFKGTEDVESSERSSGVDSFEVTKDVGNIEETKDVNKFEETKIMENFEETADINSFEESKDTKGFEDTDLNQDLSSCPVESKRENTTPGSLKVTDNTVSGFNSKSITILRRSSNTDIMNNAISQPFNNMLDESPVDSVPRLGIKKIDGYNDEAIDTWEQTSGRNMEVVNDVVANGNENGELMENVTILKRPDDVDFLSDKKSDPTVKTFSQRQKEYYEARLRIFGCLNPENEADESENIQSEVQSSSGKKTEGSFYIDVNSYREKEPPAKRDKPPTPVTYEPPPLYSNGSQHPLQYFNQPAPLKATAEELYYHPHYQCADVYYPFYNTNLIPANPYEPLTPVDFFAQNLGADFSYWPDMANLLAYDFSYPQYSPNYIADATNYYCADPYVDADYVLQSLYDQQFDQQSYYYDSYVMESA